MTKLGDTEYKKYGEELRKEKSRDDMIEEKIQRLRKEKNLERRPVEANSENKRRKLNSTNYEEKKTSNGRPEKKDGGEKRNKDEEEKTQPEKKRMKQMKIGDKFNTTSAEKPLEPEDEKVTDEENEMINKYKDDPRFYNMEDIDKKRREAKEELKKKLRERKEKAELKEKSWEMARVCIEIVKENEGEWDTRADEQKEDKIRKEKEYEKAERLEK